MDSEKINITLPICPVTKKNSSQIINVKGRPVLIPSKKYREYEKQAGMFLKPLGISYPVNVQATFYMGTRRRVDLTNLLNAICDVLVKYNVLTDDNRNIIFSVDGSKVLYDKTAPRTEITITRIPENEYESWERK